MFTSISIHASNDGTNIRAGESGPSRWFTLESTGQTVTVFLPPEPNAAFLWVQKLIGTLEALVPGTGLTEAEARAIAGDR